MLKTKSFKTLLIAAVAIVGVGAYAFADGGWGYKRHHGGYGGQMMGPGHHMGYDDGGRGYGPCEHGRWSDRDSGMTEEDAQKLTAAREQFFEETADIRQGIREKRAEMRAEFVKENPDTGKLSKLQKDLSALEADMDQKRLEHRLEMRQLFPEAGKYHGRGYGRGHHRGPGGQGGNGPGYCWR